MTLEEIKQEIKVLNKKLLLQEFNITMIAHGYEYNCISFNKLIETGKTHRLRTLFCHENSDFGVIEIITEQNVVKEERFISVNNMDDIILH
jgi:hypothetical protein